MIGTEKKSKIWLLLSLSNMEEEEKTDLLYCSICKALNDKEAEKVIKEIKERLKQ